jgi:hypothetical protein
MWNVVPDVPQAQPRARESNRRRVELERRQGFDRMHAEAGRRLRLMKAGSPVP